MTQRFNVIRIVDDVVINTIMLDAPEPDTNEVRYVPAGDIGIGWTAPIGGDPVPPVATIPDPQPEATTDLAAMLAELEDLKARIAALAAQGGAA